jgi:ketosteroid isomerase-like protein
MDGGRLAVAPPPLHPHARRSLAVTIDDNKASIRVFNEHFARSDIDAILAMMSDDCTWWVLGKSHLFPVTGLLTKGEYGDLLREIHSGLRGGMQMEVRSMIAEGDRVAAEITASATTRSGSRYGNGYHILYTLDGGRITSAREYTDLMTIQNVFYR